MARSETTAQNITGQVIRESARILDCFSVETPHLHASDIVRMAGVPPSKVMEILRTLVDRHVLQRDGPFYSVGLRVIQWGASADAASDLMTAARPSVAALRDRTGECCGLQTRRGGNQVTLYLAHSIHTVSYPGYVGKVQPLLGSAAGSVLMAYDPHAYRRALDGVTTSGVVMEILQCRLEHVRRQGWVFVAEGHCPGMSALAAPVFAAGGAVVAAVSLGGPTQRLSTEQVEALADQVVGCAQDISLYLSTCG